MADSITLTCPTCGSRLAIAPDISLFACAGCGSEFMVKRSGGIVSLAPAAEGGAQPAKYAEVAPIDSHAAQLRAEIREIKDALWQEKAGIPQESLYNFFVMLDDIFHERRGTRRQRAFLGLLTPAGSREEDIKSALHSLTIEELEAMIHNCSELSSKGIAMDHYETMFKRLKRLEQQLEAQSR